MWESRFKTDYRGLQEVNNFCRYLKDLTLSSFKGTRSHNRKKCDFCSHKFKSRQLVFNLTWAGLGRMYDKEKDINWDQQRTYSEILCIYCVTSVLISRESHSSCCKFAQIEPFIPYSLEQLKSFKWCISCCFSSRDEARDKIKSESIIDRLTSKYYAVRFLAGIEHNRNLGTGKSLL